jgi:hypothetical protein
MLDAAVVTDNWQFCQWRLVLAFIVWTRCGNLD